MAKNKNKKQTKQTIKECLSEIQAVPFPKNEVEEQQQPRQKKLDFSERNMCANQNNSPNMYFLLKSI